MKWIELCITADKRAEEPITAILLDFAPQGLYIDDYSDIADCLQKGQGDYLEPALEAQDKEKIVFHAYLANSQSVLSTVSEIKKRLAKAKNSDNLGKISLKVQVVKEENWADGWKQYYQPMHIGKRLVVRPSWENYTPAPEETVITLDPSGAFGTGTHETTKMCMIHLENYVTPGCSVLDIGSGSGILAITAALLGAEKVDAVDISPDAVKITHENAKINDVYDRVNAYCGDLYEELLFKEMRNKYDIIVANIVADVIIEMLPKTQEFLKPSGIFIASGIINDRGREVEAQLLDKKYEILRHETDGEWESFVVRQVKRR